MADARIHQVTRSSTQSGKARMGAWLLDLVPATPQRNDPLTGWVGSAETTRQVRLSFPTREAAVAYAEANALTFEIAEAKPRRIAYQAYADNFQ